MSPGREVEASCVRDLEVLQPSLGAVALSPEPQGPLSEPDRLLVVLEARDGGRPLASVPRSKKEAGEALLDEFGKGSDAVRQHRHPGRVCLEEASRRPFVRERRKEERPSASEEARGLLRGLWRSELHARGSPVPKTLCVRAVAHHKKPSARTSPDVEQRRDVLLGSEATEVEKVLARA
ncbi:MAG TPA: hypothetical protein VG479_10350 [Gaiellaceae bacterium]|jgi:hypothetical protein|nr:hypothetical protein [Gaiellaceae bacterium]